MKGKYVLIGIFILWAIACSLYGFLLRNWVIQVYQDAAPDFFANLVNATYPRFAVEKHRFPVDFFLKKADQIFIRGTFVLFIVGLISLGRKQKIWDKLTQKQYSKQHAQLLSLLFYTGLLYYTWDWIFDLQQLSALQGFYKPVFLFKLLHLPLLSGWLFTIVYGVFIISVLGVIILRYPGFSWVVAILFIIMQGYYFSFEKVDHGYATLTYATLLMPFFITELSQQTRKQNIQTWSLPVIQTAIAGAYLLAGLEKIFTGGFSWATAHTFRTYLSQHPTPLGEQVAESELLCTLLPVGALLFQLGFILMLFFPRLRYIFIPAGILFHVGTVLLFNIGAYFSPWIFVYIFYINWGWVIEKLSAYPFTNRWMSLLRLLPQKSI